MSFLRRIFRDVSFSKMRVHADLRKSIRKSSGRLSLTKAIAASLTTRMWQYLATLANYSHILIVACYLGEPELLKYLKWLYLATFFFNLFFAFTFSYFPNNKESARSQTLWHVFCYINN